MTGYLQDVLHIPVLIREYEDAQSLPLYLKSSYALSTLELAGTVSLIARPYEKTNLAAMRKQREQLKKLTGMECVLWLQSISGYVQKTLTSEGIPFIVEGKQVYLPFAAIALIKSREKQPVRKERLGFGAQRLLLWFLYSGQKEITIKEAAQGLGISAMTVSRCFDELQGTVDALSFGKAGKSRCMALSGTRTGAWEAARPFLHRPVFREYHLEAAPAFPMLSLGGMSALCRYTMLSDNPYPTYAVTKQQDKDLNLSGLPCVPDGEQPLAVIQVMQYQNPLGQQDTIDPLSAILTLSDEEMKDPRIEGAVEQILEEYLNG